MRSRCPSRWVHFSSHQLGTQWRTLSIIISTWRSSAASRLEVIDFPRRQLDWLRVGVKPCRISRPLGPKRRGLHDDSPRSAALGTARRTKHHLLALKFLSFVEAPQPPRD